MTIERDPRSYVFPEEIATMTTRMGDGEAFDSAQDYLAKHHFALAADFAITGLRREDIQTAVREEQIKAAPWPLKERVTDFFWGIDDPSVEKLEGLATKAIAACYGQDEQQPIGGNVMSVGGEMGSQQLALAGLVYAREHGDLREIMLPEADALGVMYVVRDSFSGRMFEKVIPEDTAQ